MKAGQWYRFQNATEDPSTVDIHIIDIIGDWIDELINEWYGLKATVTAKAFIQQLADLPDAVKNIRLHINSPGGDVFAATNIANALRDQQLTKGRTVETIVDGLAASAASIIAMAGKKVTVADTGIVMIHNPWSVAIGNAADMRKTADTLDAVRNTIVAAYKWHSELSDEAIVALMDAETWMSAQEALDNGFATDIIEGLEAAASIDPRAIASMKVPEKFRARVDALMKKAPVAAAPAEPKAIVAACKAAGFADMAEELLGLPMDQVTARLTTAKNEKQQRDSRASEIRALCSTAKLPELADGYITGSMALADVRTHLNTITVRIADRVQIDGSLHPNQPATATSTLSPTAIYAERNKPKKENRL